MANTVEIIRLPEGGQLDNTNSWVRFTQPMKAFPVKYELRVPMPQSLDDEGCIAICGKPLEEVVRLGIFACGHSADNIASLELFVVNEGEVYNHAANYTPEKHNAMQQAFVEALLGANRRKREPGAVKEKKLARVKKDAQAELIASLIAAGALPEGFSLDPK